MYTGISAETLTSMSQINGTNIKPEPVTEHQKTKILWDLPVHTDCEIKANRPDFILKCKDQKSWLLIDIAIPTDKNISTKVTEKLSKYKDLEIEIERMWGMKPGNTSSDWSSRSHQERKQKIFRWHPSKYPITGSTENHIAWYSSHPMKNPINKMKPYWK